MEPDHNNNGWAEHKIHVTSEIKDLRKDVDRLMDMINLHIIEDSRRSAEIRSEIKYHSKIIIAATGVLSLILSAILGTLLPRLF